MDVGEEGLVRHQSRSFLFSWPLTTEDDDDDEEVKRRVAAIVVDINKGKTLLYFSIFVDQGGRRLVHCLLKYGTPTRWKQLSDTLRDGYQIVASIRCALPKAGFKACMYPALYVHCLHSIDSRPYLSSAHPSPRSFIRSGKGPGAKTRTVRAPEDGDVGEGAVCCNAVEGYVGKGGTKAVSFGEGMQCSSGKPRSGVEGEDRMDKVEGCLEEECSCESPSLWLRRISRLVMHNLGEEGAQQLREDIIENIEEGRSSKTNVVIYGVPFSGKAAILRPLAQILKCAKVPKKGKLSLKGLSDCECILFNQFSLEHLGDGLDLETLLSLLEGRPVEVNNTTTFDELVPIFITCNSLPEPQGERHRNALRERLGRCHYFPHKLERDEREKPIKPCCRCFADWLLTERYRNTDKA